MTVALLSMGACKTASSSTKIDGTWENPDYTGPALGKLLVIGAAPKQSSRELYEKVMVEALREQGADAEASFVAVGESKRLTKSQVRTVVEQGGFDGVVAMGGGSGLDLAKLVAFMAGQTRPVWDFEDVGDNWTRADADAIAPVVAIPTTAGTGSEVGRAAVITRTATHSKKIIFHPRMMPAVVICDPVLTVGLPPDMTAGTGMDAFVHCLEAYSTPAYHPMAQGIALEGMRLVWENLPRVYADGADVEARGIGQGRPVAHQRLCPA